MTAPVTSSVTSGGTVPAVALRGITKRYTKYEDTPALFNAARMLFTRTRRTELVAVNDVDLEVAPGECLGVLGRNGSGKSTLLQMMAGVTGPSAGRITVRGRVAPLISVGVGFHPELTGRENVFVNAAILGLTRAEVQRRFDAIVDFAEIEDFIDTPVKFYSSGMYVRLGFAVATQVDPDVLLVDEVLAVGDLGFQMKCFERMREIREAGATVVGVTHNHGIVRRIFDRAIVLDHGVKQFEGAPDDAVTRLYELTASSADSDGLDLGWAVAVRGVADLTLDGLVDARGRPTSAVEHGDEVVVRVTTTAHEELEGAFVAIAVTAPDGTLVYSDGSGYDAAPTTQTAGTSRPAEVRFAADLPTGSYAVSAALCRPGPRGAKQQQLASTHAQIFHVTGRPFVRGVADLHATFTTPDQPARRARRAPAVRPKR